MSIPDQADLIEQHPELRLRFYKTYEAIEAQGSRLVDRPGAYEWWQFEAFDETGNGITVALYNGDPFHPTYRRAVRRNLSGQPVDAAHLRATTFPAARVSIFQEKNLVARGHWATGPRSLRVGGRGRSWSAQIGPVNLETNSQANGWRLRIQPTPTQRLGIKGYTQPNRNAGNTIQNVDLQITPTFQTTTIQRAAMPDSPDGSTHDWLIVCPAATVTGNIELTNPAPTKNSSSSPASPIHIELNDETLGSLNHFWGTGLLGNGLRRWYRGSLITPQGAIFTELPVIRKYIQLAGTLMHFAPASDAPALLRCDHQHSTGFQRSSWLLAHPLAMEWRNQIANVEIAFPIAQLHDAQPFRGLTLCSTQFEAGVIPDELILGPRTATFEILQPARADWRCWQRYLTAHTPKPDSVHQFS